MVASFADRIMDITSVLVVLVATFCAGGVNALAGGGTAISFPGFVWAGLPATVANATNAFALIPGSLGGAYTFREELKPQLRRLATFLIPAILGSLAGATVLATSNGDTFKKIVPFLVLMATIVFAFSKPINAWARTLGKNNTTPSGEISRSGYGIGVLVQFCIAFYGGYFGAGMGILMLSLMGIIGMTDLRKMNALKNVLAAAINTTAVIRFFAANSINVAYGLVGAVGALAGGYLMGRMAKRIPQPYVRGFVIVFGCVATVWLLYRAFAA